ncbi:MAG: DNA replication/repair protein RecF [Gammaproteobacteria bacterium]|nr:DNA replication/repair protein RecF [Gammaproteobacteria bacterium]
MLTQLSISNLRNITELNFIPSCGINLIIGDNGSGKTTLLEAIHLLALGRSFRTRALKNVVQFSQQRSLVLAKMPNDIPIGLEYSLSSGLKIRLNSAPVNKLSELVTHLPLQFIPANCHHIFEQGPRYRRQLLDWGLFHVEHQFNYHWQSYKKIVQQRNSALRQRKNNDEIRLWDHQYALHGETITNYRVSYLAQLLQEFTNVFTRLCPELKGSEFTTKYKNGWTKASSLQQALIDSLERDKQLLYTKCGSHAADWIIKINDGDPAEILSRGQQKLYFIALSLAQTNITNKAGGGSDKSSSLLLIDDLSSELDVHHQLLVLKELSRSPAQCFITTTDFSLSERIKEIAHKVFHVKHGQLVE